MSTPSTTMLPPLGLSMPAMRFSSVLLPEPDGPISDTKSPRADIECRYRAAPAPPASPRT